MSLKWKKLEIDDEINNNEDSAEEVFYGIEELDGDYEFKNGEIALSNKSKAKKKSTPKKEKPVTISKRLEETSVDLPEWESLGLHSALLRGLEKMKFLSPTPIQRLCIPGILAKGRDVLGSAETGSGKTLAYGLPILSRLLSNPEQASEGLYALILTPTRELALQVTKHLQNVLCEVPLEYRPRIEAIVGGLSEKKQERILARKPQIIAATVGRFLSLKDDVEHLSKLKTSLQFLVLDEADRMIDPKNFEELLPFLDSLKIQNSKDKTLKKWQTLLFSATLLNKGEKSKKTNDSKKNLRITDPFSLMERLGRRGKPLVCDISNRAVEKEEVSNSNDTPPSQSVDIPKTIDFFLLECTEDEKGHLLHYILSTTKEKTILVFVNTINATKKVATILSLSFPNIIVSTLHASMEQKQRLDHLEKFAGKSTEVKLRVLVASDVAARGLDLPSIDLVIHYAIPKNIDTFIHRSGRCGRAGRPGTVISMCSGLEVKEMGKLRSAIKPREMNEYPVNELQLEEISQRVKICEQLEKLTSELNSQAANESWKKRTAAEAELDLDEESEKEETLSVGQFLVKTKKEQHQQQMKLTIAKLKRDLANLLNNPNSRKVPGQNRQGRKKVKN